LFKGCFGGIYPRGCIFPLGLYSVPESDFEAVKKAGFNLVHIYSSTMNDEAAVTYLQAAQDIGIKVRMNMPETQLNADESFWKDYIKKSAAYDSLAWWYLPEEPALSKVNNHITMKRLPTQFMGRYQKNCI
jgi:hypothetical protein